MPISKRVITIIVVKGEVDYNSVQVIIVMVMPINVVKGEHFIVTIVNFIDMD